MRYGQNPGRCLLLSVLFIICLTGLMLLNIHHTDLSSDTAELAPPLTEESYSYGIVLDCGSSGTRVYIYFWPPHSGDSHQLLDIDQLKDKDGKPLSKKKTPGLSTFHTNTSNAAEYLIPLLKFAADVIPNKKHSSTPLYILATAGMRLIPKQSADEILDDITRDIPKWFEFQFERSHAEVIPGKTEGMYAWISLNYMLGRLPHGGHASTEISRQSRQPTVGVIDMGGGSLQIAFEVEKSKLKNKEKLVTFSLGSADNDPFHTYSLYVTTFLGFGANSAMARYRQGMVSRSSVTRVKDNCLALDSTEHVEHEGKQYTLEGTGNVTACMLDIRYLLNQTEKCSIKPCSLNGVYQPSISSSANFYGISEYWYSTYDVLGLQGQYESQKLLTEAQNYCGTHWAENMKKYKDNQYPHADMERMRVECFKVSWIMTVFHEGLHFSKRFENFLPVNEIGGEEVQWSLGALIHKTRHLAAKQIQWSTHHISNRSSFDSVSHIIRPYGLAFCFFIVIGAIIIYLKKMNVGSKLKPVPSMSDFMTSADQVEQGLIVEKRYYP
ncbi:ectonucleoside triphosphate diphosphohydrolase 7-like isoform X2 [Watersipora subatra]